MFRQGQYLGLPIAQQFDLSRHDSLQGDSGHHFSAFADELRRFAFDDQDGKSLAAFLLCRDCAGQADIGGSAGRCAAGGACDRGITE